MTFFSLLCRINYWSTKLLSSTCSERFSRLSQMKRVLSPSNCKRNNSLMHCLHLHSSSNSSASYFSCPDREHADVTTFLSLHSHNNILNLFLLYLRTLCTKWDTRWPLSLKSLYCRVFNTVSSHFCAGKFSVYVDRIENEHTSAGHQDAELLRTNSMVLVLFAELTLNSCIEVGEFQRGGEEEKFPSLLFQGKNWTNV